MASIYLEDSDFQLWHGDAIDALCQMDDESVDMVCTSPPYWNQRDYGEEGQIGLEETPEQYVEKLVAVFGEVRRVLAPHGTIWLNLGSSYASGDMSPTQSHQPQRAPAYGSDGRAPQDSLDPGSSYSGLCDGCRAVTQSHRESSVGSGQPHEQDEQQLARKVRDSEHSDSASTSPGVLLPSSLESTTPEFEQRLQDSCSHCANCGACLSVLRSSSRDARLCVRKGEYMNDTEQTSLESHISGTGASGTAWSKYKPKDLVPVPWLVAMALQKDGWYLRSDIIWSKNNPMPESITDRPTKSHEYIFLLSKNYSYYFDQEAVREPAEWNRWGDQTNAKYEGSQSSAGWIKPKTKEELNKKRSSYPPANTGGNSLEGHVPKSDEGLPVNPAGRNIRSVWTIPTANYTDFHYAAFPEELAKRCILAGCPEGGTALDPFMGSGTVAYVARGLGRKSVGIELSLSYCELVADRMKQLSLFG